MSDKNRKKKKGPTPKKAPVQADPHKQKATIAQFATLAQEAQDAHKSLATQTNRAVNELWRNQQEVMQGLGAAEFNLRAHQKVMNGMALALGDLYKRFGVEAIPAEFLFTKEVSLEGEAPMRRIDWPAYHKMVEDEIKAAQAVEKAAKEAAEKAEKEKNIEAIKAAEAAMEAETPAATPETPPPAEPGTVEAKEDGEPEVPDGATVFS